MATWSQINQAIIDAQIRRMNAMKTYAIHFNGHWPVGACAVVVATDEQSAKIALMAELQKSGLDKKNVMDDLGVTELDTSKPGVTILLDGEY